MSGRCLSHNIHIFGAESLKGFSLKLQTAANEDSCISRCEHSLHVTVKDLLHSSGSQECHQSCKSLQNKYI